MSDTRKGPLSRVDDDAISFWLAVAVAVFTVWLAGRADSDQSSLFYLFSAAYILIHAHGFRILAAIKKQSKEANDE